MQRRCGLAITVALGLAAASAAATVASAEPSFVIAGDRSISGFPRDGRLGAAFAIFGAPETRRVTWHGPGPGKGGACVLTWPLYGITMSAVVNVWNENPCGERGDHMWTRVTDRRWRTSAGLRIGDSFGRMRRLYPRSRRSPAAGVWYLTRRSIAGIVFPGLEARLRRGRVASLTLYGPRGLR